MRFEDYLLLVRDGILDQKETAAARKSKVIGQEIEAAKRLQEWVKNHGDVRLVQTPEEALEALSRFDSGAMTGIDIETAKASGHPKAGLLPEVSQVRLLQLWQPNQPVLVVDCFKAGYGWLKALTQMRLVAHNALFETKHLMRVMPQVPDITCSMLMMRPIAGKNLSLVKTMREVGDMLVDVDASDALDIELSKSLQVSDWSREELLQEQVYYAAADAIAACLLHKRLTTIYENSDIEYSHADMLLQRMVRVVARQAPICLDRQEHAKVTVQWGTDIAEAREALSAQGLSKPQSVPSKQAWLAEMLSAEDLLDWPLTPTGNLSTSADVILARDLPQLKTLTTFTRTSSLAANFGQKLVDVAVGDALHPNYKIAAAATGRFACSEPNLQNIPKELRHLFTAPKGWKLVTGDLSQIELRVAGILADEVVINEAYRNREDLHRLMGAKLAGISVDQVTKKERQQAKAANFGLLFGAGTKTLQQYASRAYGVEMDMGTAQETKRAFHAMYPSLTQWQQRIVAETNLLGYSQSHHYKLRRHYSEEVYTHAMNFPVQSTAAEILMSAMIYIDDRLPADGSIRICLTVYDELMLVARDEEVETAALLLRDGFKHGFLTVFPDGTTNGLVGIGAGQDWAEAADDGSVRKEWSL
jgi:DNA polymerase I-like protein with 3'-5' exonuclease and polymerase domains